MATSCQVRHGVYEGVFPVAGKTVRSMRRIIQPAINVDPNSQAVINGVEAGDDYIIPPGATVSFIKGPGRKALGDLLTPAQVRRQWKITESQYQGLCKLGLPTVELAGEPRHPEVAVDEWFRSRSGRSPVAVPAPTSTPLNPRESKIVQALAQAGKELKGPAIARRASLRANSNFRTTLRNLYQRGILVKGIGGYGLAPGVRT
jgi:hypothetical protein